MSLSKQRLIKQGSEKKKNDKLNHIKIKNLHSLKNIVKGEQLYATMWEKIFIIHTAYHRPYSEYGKNFYRPIIKGRQPT